jgi:hypothetical protein
VVRRAAFSVQRYDVQDDDVLVGMLGVMAVVLNSMMLCCAVYCGERYAVQHVEFSDMIYSMMMCWSACWITCCIGHLMLCFCDMLW